MKYMLLAPALLVATAAFAHQGVKDPQVMARMQLMTKVADDMKALGEMVKGVTAYDAAAVQTRAASLNSHAGETIRLFEPEATDPKSEALPEIWTSFADFTARAQDMGVAAKSLKAASEGEFQAAFGELAKTCSSCHKSFRAKN